MIDTHETRSKPEIAIVAATKMLHEVGVTSCSIHAQVSPTEPAYVHRGAQPHKECLRELATRDVPGVELWGDHRRHRRMELVGQGGHLDDEDAMAPVPLDDKRGHRRRQRPDVEAAERAGDGAGLRGIENHLETTGDPPFLPQKTKEFEELTFRRALRPHALAGHIGGGNPLRLD
jgi:hypothetical protein